MILQKYTTKSYYHIPKAEDFFFFFHAVWKTLLAQKPISPLISQGL